MKQNQLTLDAQSSCLRSSDIEMKIYTITRPVKVCEALAVHESKYTDQLNLYPNLTAPPNHRKPVKHGIVHHLPTKGRQPNIKTRRVSPEKYIKIKQQIDEMITSSLLIPSYSKFGSPLLVVPKVNTSEIHLVSDYKVLNKMLIHGQIITHCQISAQLMNCYMVAIYFPLLILNQLFTTCQMHLKVSTKPLLTLQSKSMLLRKPFLDCLPVSKYFKD